MKAAVEDWLRAQYPDEIVDCYCPTVRVFGNRALIPALCKDTANPG